MHGLIKRLEQGESVRLLNLGDEISDSTGREMLRRMIKFWGLTPQRKFARTKTRGHMSLCMGINALHFFSSGRKPFTPPQDEVEQMPAPAGARSSGSDDEADATDTEVIDLAVVAQRTELPKWLAGAKLSTVITSYSIHYTKLYDLSDICEHFSGLLFCCGSDALAKRSR